MKDDTVVFSKTIAGVTYSVTAGQVFANDEVAQAVIGHGIHRIANSARTNAEDKDLAEANRLEQLQAGTMWRQGGGNAMDERQRLYREHLASWVQKHCNMKRTDASKAVRQSDAKALEDVAKAILKAKGEKPNADRIAAAAANLEARIMKDVDASLSMQDVDI